MAYSTIGELRDLALTKAGEVASSQSKFYAKMLEYVSISYLDVLSSSNKFNMDFDRPWTWARATVPVQVTLRAPYESGTVAMTNASAAGTFSVAPGVGLGSLAGWYLYLDSQSEIYRIATHTAGASAFTIVGTFVGTTASYSHGTRKLSYDLGSSILRLSDPGATYKQPAFGNGEYQVHAISAQQLATDFPLRLIRAGMPAYFAETNVKDSIYEITFSGYVDEETKIEFPYIAKPGTITAATVPLIPEKDREVLAYCGAAMLLFQEKSDPAKGSILFNVAKQKMQAMAEEEKANLKNSGRWTARIISRPGQIGRPNSYFYRGF